MFIVALILVAAIAVNVVVNVRFNAISDRFPFIGAAVWVALLVSVPLRRPAWEELPNALKGSIFLLSLDNALSWRRSPTWRSSDELALHFVILTKS